VSLMCFSWQRARLLEWLRSLRRKFTKEQSGTLKFYTSAGIHGAYWNSGLGTVTKTARHLSIVCLPREIKDRVLSDADTFLQSYEFYRSRGLLNYKCSYLFHGVPGSGKTSCGILGWDRSTTEENQ
jgi:hypothetical protein